MSGGRLHYLRIGLHEPSVIADKMSPLGTEETQCCSHHSDVKYHLEVILHVCFREAGSPKTWRCRTPDSFLEIAGMCCGVSLLGVLLTTSLAACESIRFLWPLVTFRVTGGSSEARVTPWTVHHRADTHKHTLAFATVCDAEDVTHLICTFLCTQGKKEQTFLNN